MAIQEIAPLSEVVSSSEISTIRTASPLTTFADWLNREVAEVNTQIQTAETKVQQLAAGQEDNLHQVMLSLQKASISFELMVQVRNKLLEGYQEIMRMQV